MMGLGGGLRKTLCRTLFFYLGLAAIIVGTHGLDPTPCAANTLPPSGLNVNITGNDCYNVPVTSTASYTLWYQRGNSTGGTTLSIVLKVPVQSPPVWYGMGFNSRPNQMAGTAAVIFWLNSTSQAPIFNTYSLTGNAATAVNVDTTRFTFESQPEVTKISDSVYLTFDAANANTSMFNFQNFAIGASGDIPPGDVTVDNTQEHQSVSSFQINFVTNQLTLTSSDLNKRVTTHGILNIIGWGVLLPHGAIVARYFKGFDPQWFYVHAGLQLIGYAFVLAGFITGNQLLADAQNANPSLDADGHKGLAIFVFVLASIQLTAILLRPKKEAKLRRYWNWGHWWLGRLAIVLAIIDIFVGIHIADGGKTWNLGYGVTLAMEVVLIIGLEAWLWTKYARSRNENRLPQTAMQNRDSANGAAAMAPPPPQHESSNGDKGEIRAP